MCGAISSKKKIHKEEWEEFIEKFDENQDRQIDYNEFKKMMMSFHEHFAEVEEVEEVPPSQPHSNDNCLSIKDHLNHK